MRRVACSGLGTAVVAALLAAACGGDGGSGGASSDRDPAGYRRCESGQRWGAFTLQLVAAAMDTPAHSTVSGRLRNGVSPRELWETRAQAGDCRLAVSPRLLCAETCAAGTTCGREGACVAEPTARSAGKLTLTGLSAPVTMDAVSGGYYADLPTGTPFPPATPGTPLRLEAAGDEAPRFSLAARAIEPLAFNADLVLRRGQPLAVTWTRATVATGARIDVVVDIAHHGGVAARIECAVDDTGSMTIPASLSDALLDQGTAGFPMITLTRQTVDSTSVGDGCAELAVASPVDRLISVDGVLSCSDELPCPAGRTCGTDRKCQ